MAPRKRGDETVHITCPLHRKRCELQPCDPSFGPLVEQGDLRSREAKPHHSFQEGSTLILREAQVTRPDFDQLTPCAHT